MKFPRSLSIRAGLVLLALLAVLPALALQLYDGITHRRHLVADATMNVRRAAAAVAQTQSRITDGTRMLLRTLADMPEVRRLNTTACNALFASLLRQNPIYLNILATNRQGDIVASGLPSGQVNLADRKHFREAMGADGFAAGEYIVSRTGYDPAFPFALPIRDPDGKVAGVLIAAIKLSSYDTTFDRLLLPPGSMLGITDHAGLRLYYRPKTATNPLGAPIKNDVWKAISRGGEEGVFLLAGSDGKPRYYAYHKLSLGPGQPPYMAFVVGLPEATVLGPARKSLVANLLFLTAAAGLAVCVAWFVGGAVIARRLDRIAATADRIGQGDLTVRTGVPHGDSGIGKVARTMDAMAGLLAEHDAARNEALAALRQSQERMAHIAASMADWIWETDAEGRYIYVSPKITEALGYTPEAMLGRMVYDFLTPDTVEETRERIRWLKAGQEPLRDCITWRLTRDGERRCIMTNGVPWKDETGRFRGYRGVDKDVTEQVRAEQSLRDSLAEKDILLKEIHHRVKNNLQIISGLLYLQEERVRDPAALESFRESRNRIASMALVHEELYRSSNLSHIRLDAYIRDLIPRLFGPAEEAERPACDAALAPVDVPIETAVPAGLIINELLTNAYKHAFRGRPDGRLRISLEEQDNAVTLRIGDNGPGLPPDFDATAEGTLGIQLVSNLTRQLRGTLDAANDDQGAVFTLRFHR